MPRLWDPGCLANISGKVSPHTCVSWHILQTMFPTEKTGGLCEVSAGVRITRNKDGGVVLDINRGKVFNLNGIGALIFERLRERQNETQIVRDLSQQFDIPVETVRTDFIEFLKALEQQGLVTIAHGSSP